MNFKVAVVMLACRDYEATELALACHMRYLPEGTPLFVLQNCRGNYDAERTLDVARRYANLFPGRIHVVDNIVPGAPYHSVQALLSSFLLSGYDLVCKTDDDAFPIAPGWLEALIAAYGEAEQSSGPQLAYVTPLINNNTWGFAEVLRAMGLEQEYFSTQARPHYVGKKERATGRPRIAQADEIVAGVNGTIWGYPYIARWLHERTTLQPDRFIAATANLSNTDVPSKDRYSIGCILFRPQLWAEIATGEPDDEHMMHMHCAKNDLRIVCVRSVPFVHLAYFTQREEIRDITAAAKAVYAPRLGFPFPIGLRANPQLELEARLRWLEQCLTEREADSRVLKRKAKKILSKLGLGK